MTFETIEFAIGVLIFLGSLVSVWISLTKKVEKVDLEVKGLIEYKNESATLVRNRFTKMDTDMDKKFETMEKHFDHKMNEMKSEREVLAAALEKYNDKIWSKLDAIENKIDAKFQDLAVLKAEHERLSCKYEPTKKNETR